MLQPRPPGVVPAVVAILCVGAGGCALPRVPFLSGHYRVSDPATATVWCSDRVKREGSGVVEFRDGRSGAWVSVPGAEVAEITAAEYRSCLAR